MFTKEQIKNWESYEKVRQSGQINMLDAPRGSQLANLSYCDYCFCLENYTELKKQFKNENILLERNSN
jgi:hypothetical protein